MKPMLEAMAKAGLLTDQFGNKLDDLTSLKFADSLEDIFKGVADKLSHLIDLIRELLDLAGRAVVC